MARLNGGELLLDLTSLGDISLLEDGEYELTEDIEIIKLAHTKNLQIKVIVNSNIIVTGIVWDILLGSEFHSIRLFEDNGSYYKIYLYNDKISLYYHED